MKKYFFLVILAAFSINAFSQQPELSKSEQRKLQKQLKKEQQAEEAAKKAAIIGLMVEHRQFVLEADRLRDKMGVTVNVSSMINFLAVDSITGVIQIGSNAYVGLNGVGGITVEGRVTNYKYTFNEKSASYNISYNVASASGTYDITLSVFSDGRADATVRSNWPGQLNYSGYLVPPSMSKVFKGTPRY